MLQAKSDLVSPNSLSVSWRSGQVPISDQRCDTCTDFRLKMWHAYRFQTKDVTSKPMSDKDVTSLLISDQRRDKHTNIRPKMWQAYQFLTNDVLSWVWNRYACHILGLKSVCLSHRGSEIAILVTSWVWNCYRCHILGLQLLSLWQA